MWVCVNRWAILKQPEAIALTVAVQTRRGGHGSSSNIFRPAAIFSSPPSSHCPLAPAVSLVVDTNTHTGICLLPHPSGFSLSVINSSARLSHLCLPSLQLPLQPCNETFNGPSFVCARCLFRMQEGLMVLFVCCRVCVCACVWTCPRLFNFFAVVS